MSTGDRSDNSRIPRAAAAAIGLSVIFAVLGFMPPILGMQRMLFLFNFIYLVMLPGYFLSRRIFEQAGKQLGLLISFIMGSAALYIVLFVFDLAGIDVSWARILYLVIIVALSLLEIFRPPVIRAKAVLWTRFEPGPISQALLIVLLLGVTIVVMISQDPLIYTGDSLDHIAYVRTISRTGEVFPERFYYQDGGTLTRDIRKGIGHAYWGTLNSLTGSNEAHRIWPLVSWIGLVFVTVAISCSGQTLFQSSSIGLIGAALFLLFYRGSMRGNLISTITFPFSFGKIFYISALAFLPGYLRSGRKSHLLLIVVSILVATWTHVSHLMIFLFLLGIAGLIFLLRDDSGSRTSVLARCSGLAAVLLAVNLPYLLVRYIRDYDPNNPIHTHIQGILYFSDSLYIINPTVLMQGAGILGLLAILSIFLLWGRAKKDASLSLLLGGTAASFILLMNPLWVPFLIERLSYLLLRFEFTAPSVLVVAYLLRTLWRELRGSDRRLPRPVSALAGLLVVLLLGLQAARLPSRASRLPGTGPERNPGSSYRIMDLYEAINESIPDGSVITADPVTSYCIPAFTDMFVMCPLDQHSTPNDSTALERITDSRLIFASSGDPVSIARMMTAYDSRYLVVNGRIPNDVGTMFWKPDRASADRSLSDISERPDIFEQLFSRDGLTLLRMKEADLDTFPDSIAGIPAWIGKQAAPADTLRFMASGEEQIFISRVDLDRLEVRRGETADMEITWVKTGSVPMRGYICYVRFDTEYERGAIYNESYGKIYRKIREKLDGMRFRFRVDHQPLAGIHSPDTWPDLVEVIDRFSIRIPNDISPGLYEIRLKLSTKTHYPNYTLDDILTDDDVYSGALVGRLIIR